MSFSETIKNMIEESAKSLHVAFLAKVLSVDGNRAKIQPLGLTRDYGGTEKKQAVLTNVYIANSAMYKVTAKEIEYVTDVVALVATKDKETFGTVRPIKSGDIVLCVCCDRNIDAALKGENSLPPVGYHNQSDCVIVSII